MKLLGVINEPPLDPISWSGTSRYFFRALDQQGILGGAVDVSMSKLQDMFFRAVNFSMPVSVWREKYHLDPGRFRFYTRIAGRRIRDQVKSSDAVVQIGAWYCLPAVTDLPCFSYHDGNLALRVKAGHIKLASAHRAVQRALEWERRTYERLRGLFVMSEWLGSSFVADFGVPHSKVHVVGAGINFDSVPEAEPDRRYPPRFLMVGKDFERKGGYILLEAFRQVRLQIPEAELVLVGPQLSNPPDGVTCTGYLSKSNPADVERLQSIYRSAGVYVLPSLYEPFGISLLEAMAYSLPCIAADHCAMPEIVAHKRTGLIVKRGDADSLAQAMLELASSEETAAAYGRAGRQRLLERYTWSAVARAIKDVVASVL